MSWITIPRNYAEQTHASPSRLIRFAHLKRFQVAVDLCTSVQPDSFLDWGAGDGFLVRSLIQKENAFASGFLGAYDPEPTMMQLLESNFSRERKEGRVKTYQSLRSLQTDLEENAIELDLIACQEVLEHMPLNERNKFYTFCDRFLSLKGTCIVEVPVEIGLSISIKEFGRFFLKGRHPEYTLAELCRTTAGLVACDRERNDPNSCKTWIQGHKGFDYRKLRRELQEHFCIKAEISTPMRSLPPFLGNQSIFFILQKN